MSGRETSQLVEPSPPPGNQGPFPGEEVRGRTPTRSRTIPPNLDLLPQPSTSPEESKRGPSWWDLIIDAFSSPILTAAMPFVATAIVPPDSVFVASTLTQSDQRPAQRPRASTPMRRVSARHEQIPDYTPFPTFESYRPPPLYRILSRSLSRSRSHTEPAEFHWKQSRDAEDSGKLKVDHEVWMKRTNGHHLARNRSRLEWLRREGS